MEIFEIILKSSFVVKGVIFILITASVYSWAVIILKLKEMYKREQDDQIFYEVLKSGKQMEEILISFPESNGSPCFHLFKEGYLKYKDIRLNAGTDPNKIKDYFNRFGFNAIERSLKKGGIDVSKDIESRLSILASIGSISPFVGLFGTVWGIINAFSGLSRSGTSIEAVAPGIAEALVVTALGLAVAIPAVFFFNSLMTKSNRFSQTMESFGQYFLNLVEKSISSMH